MDVNTSRKYELKKHAAVIHSASQLTLIQRKLCNALLYKAYPNLQTVEIHQITVREILDLIGFASHNQTVVKDALKALIKTVVEWNMLDEQNLQEDWTASSILSSVRLKGPDCYYSYSPHLRELLYQPSLYGQLNMEIQAKFKSAYGLVLYENCMRYRRLQYTRWFELPLFRKLMGVKSNQYAIFRDFKRRVLDVGVKEVNQFSDFEITPEFKRDTRAVTAVRFLLKTKATLTVIDKELALPSVQSVLNILLNDFAFSFKQANALISDYGQEFIQEKVNLVLTSPSFASGKIKNLAGYLLKSLQADFKQAPSSSHRLQEVRAKQHVEALTAKRLQLSADARALQYAEYTRSFLQGKMVGELDSRLQQEFVAFYAAQGNHFIIDRFKKKGLSDKIVWANFEAFIKVSHSHLLLDMRTIDDF